MAHHRYAWAMNPSQRNLLHDKEGLPAFPFRTYTWPLFDLNLPAVLVIKLEKTNEARDAKRNFRGWTRHRMTLHLASRSRTFLWDLVRCWFRKKEFVTVYR